MRTPIALHAAGFMAAILLIGFYPVHAAASAEKTPAPRAAPPSTQTPTLAGPLHVLARGLKNPEGPVFDQQGRLLICEMGKKQITWVHPDGTQTKWATTGGTPNGAILANDGRIWVADSGLKAIVALPTSGPNEGQPTTICDSCDGQPFKGPNDLIMDHAGNLYFTDPVGSSPKHPTGAVYRYDAGTKKVSRLADNLAFPNGIVLSTDEKTLYVAENQEQTVWAYALRADGTLGPRTVAGRLKEGKPWFGPDGIALDAKGRLLTCQWGLSCIAVFENGALIERIALPDANPSNLEFGGPDHKTLYITADEHGAVYTLPWDSAGQNAKP